MANQTPAELLALELRAQDFAPENVPSHRIQAPTAFLSLAPTTSASYPTQQSKTLTSPNLPAAVSPAAPLEAIGEVAATPTTMEIAASLKTRRSSSITSEGSTGSAKQRFLKLGPVHFGEGDGKGDWSEVIE